MAYIGNQVSSVPFIIDTFSGTGSATVFGQLTRAPAGVASIAVFISGVYKTPGVDYTLNGDIILFTTAPASGTNNIVIHHMGNGSATQVPSDGSVTGGKLAANTVRGNNIVAGQITGNQLGTYSISGNNIGTGAISANNFAGGGITSNVLASNLSISLTRALESANINAIAPNGLINIDVANNVVYYFNANSTANITFNLRANTQNTFDSVTTIGQSATVAMIVRHGTGRHSANLQIDGTLQSPVFAGGARPNFLSITNAETNIFGYTVLKLAANSYAVFASNSLFTLG
jgi:ribosomal protein L27